jgi:hypothetical protein
VYGQGILFTEDNFFYNSLIALTDIRHFTLSIKSLPNDTEKRILCELCNDFLAYIMAQTRISKRLSVSHIAYPVIVEMEKKLDKLNDYFANADVFECNVENIVSEIDDLLALYIRAFPKTSKNKLKPQE